MLIDTSGTQSSVACVCQEEEENVAVLNVARLISSIQGQHSPGGLICTNHIEDKAVIYFF